MITLTNEKMTVSINELGAEIKSIRCNDTEYIWGSLKEVWSDCCPLLFPICGGLKDNKYTFEGKEYTLQKHGYGSETMFEVESASATQAIFFHQSNEETRACFPFDYELRIIYTLDDTSLKVTYQVDNKSGKTMYFSIGSHEGYYTPEGIEDYDVVFPQNETLSSYVLYGNLLSDQKLPIIKDTNVLPLYDKYFTIDALVFKDLQSRSAVLRNRKTGKAVKVDFDYAPYFLLWHKPNAPYICLEPWAGVQDIVGSSYDITEKEGIIALEKDKTYTADHTITILA
ncbi:MAG: aldose 1-epimerase family protein [Clostridia bacterium]|nr:aldose 1-epimerase family protein [Clostridia bacterium]